MQYYIYETIVPCFCLYRLFANCYDDAARFVRLCAKPGCTYLQTDDLAPLVQDVVESHPGLTFLQDSPEFHSRYVHTVSTQCNLIELHR